MATDNKEKKARSQRIERILENAVETAEERTRRVRKQKRKKAILKWALIVAAAALLLTGLFVLSKAYLIPEHHYRQAVEALEGKRFEEAYDQFAALGDYKDSADKAYESLYQKAFSLMMTGDYLAAADGFEKLPEYKDSLEQAAYCKNQEVFLQNQAAYEKAVALAEEEQYTEAIRIFEDLGEFYDSKDRRTEATYRLGRSLLEEERFEEAYAAFLSIREYKDSADLADEAKYAYAGQLVQEEEYVTALTVYSELGDYQDSQALYTECYYWYGCQLLDQQSYEEAITVFEELGDYQDSKACLLEGKYGYVLTHQDYSNELTFAYLIELKGSSYKDAASLYEDIFCWKIRVIFNTKENDYGTNKDRLSKNEPIYVHFFITGGAPGEKLNLGINYVLPNGTHGYTTFEWEWESRSNGWLLWEAGKYHFEGGTLALDFYNDDTGELLEEASVILTD